MLWTALSSLSLDFGAVPVLPVEAVEPEDSDEPEPLGESV